MKIVITVPGRWHAFDLARELNNLGHLHRLITTYPKSRTRRFGIPDEKVVSFGWMIYFERIIQNLFGFNFWRTYCAHPFMSLFSSLAARYIDGSDLVHGWSGSSEHIFQRAKKMGIPCVVERSSSHMLMQCELLREEYKKYGLKWAEINPKGVHRELREYEHADQVFVPSLFVWNSFLDKGFPQDKLFRSNFGVNVEQFKHERLALNQTDPLRIIFTSGRGVRKGLIYLKEAFGCLTPEVANLVMVGGQESGMEPFLPQGENIKLHQHVPQRELINFYQHSDVFVHPSIEEGLAVVQAQALAAGLALICTTNTGGEDLLLMAGEKPEKLDRGILKYPAGFVVPPFDAPAIAFCIKMLHQDRKLLVKMQRNALSLCDDGISWADYAKRNAVQYKVLIER